MGKSTVGYGRNLDDKGLSKREAAYLLSNDLDESEADCRRAFAPWFDTLTPARQNVLIEMCFNLGLKRLSGFGQTLKAAREHRPEDVARHMLHSVWARQVGQRAVTLAERYRVG